MTNQLSEYELQRLKNIEYNKSILRSLDLHHLASDLLPPKPVVPGTRGVKRKRQNVIKRRQSSPKANGTDISIERKFNGYLTRSKRSRLASIENGDVLEERSQSDCVGDDGEQDLDYHKRKPKFSEKIYGSIPGIPVGTVWAYRMDCSHDGVHRPTVAGIHPGPDGCYSVALSGGYEDDIDYGECFTYTGEGGRDLKGTKSNPKDYRENNGEKLSRLENISTTHNMKSYSALVEMFPRQPRICEQQTSPNIRSCLKSVESRKPVRVVRGYKLNSPYAPAEGYRYDGLYSVEKHWKAVGLKGFDVYKYALKRLPGQAPPPWLAESQENSLGTEENPADIENDPTNTNEVLSSGTEENSERTD